MSHRFACRIAALFASPIIAGPILASAAWAAPQPPDAAGAAPIRFDIQRFEVTGNTLLPAADIARAVAPFTGKDRDFGDVQRALEAVEAAFQRAGYTVVTVELPEQELEQGTVVLRVVQTTIGRVFVKNNRHFDEANIRRSLPGLEAGRTPNVTDISNSLKLANENPAKRTNLKLQSGERDDEVDATLEVTDERPWKVMANVDNTGTAQTGRTHAGIVLQHANLWNRDHVLSLQYTTTVEHPGSVKVYGAGYHVPLYALGDALDVYASYSDIDSGTVTVGVFDLAVSGRGAVYGTRYTHNLAKRGRYESKLVYGIEYKAFKNDIVLLGEQQGDHITVHPASLTYQGTWATPDTEAAGAVALVRNIPGGSRGRQEDFTRARAGAKDDYTLLRLSASWSRVLPGEWQARAIFNAQLTRDALVSGEQFGAGGAASVRGFAEREVASDAGAGANLELYTPNLCGKLAWQCRALAFYDTARVKRRHALPGELADTSIASAGLGLRLLVADNVNLQLDYGHVLRAGATQRDDANRLHVRLGLSY